MALWIRTTGATETVTPRNGTSFTVEELQALVGGYYEALRLDDGRIMWINEEGRMNDLPRNRVANDLLTMCSFSMQPADIVGDVVIATMAESGEIP